MSVCTPHERSTVAGVHAMSLRREPHVRREPLDPDVQAPRVGVVAAGRRRLVDSRRLGARCFWGRTDSAWRTGARDGRLATVKSGPHRIVYRAELPEGTIFIKHFRVPDLRATLRQWVRRGKGRNEGRRSAHLAEIGVPTIRPDRLGRKAEAKVPVRELSRHSGDPGRDSARRVRRAPPSRDGPSRSRSRVRQQLAEKLADHDCPAAQRGSPAP